MNCMSHVHTRAHTCRRNISDQDRRRPYVLHGVHYVKVRGSRSQLHIAVQAVLACSLQHQVNSRTGKPPPHTHISSARTLQLKARAGLERMCRGEGCTYSVAVKHIQDPGSQPDQNAQRAQPHDPAVHHTRGRQPHAGKKRERDREREREREGGGQQPYSYSYS